MRKVVFCDIDNSLYDIESAMFSRFPDYPINTDSYDLDEKFLREFYNPDLYDVKFLNREVVEFLGNKILQGYEVIFYSHSVSPLIYLKKLKLIKEVFSGCPLVPVVEDSELELLCRSCKAEKVVFVDDKPERLELLSGLVGVEVVGVKHPYNTEFVRGLATLTPNYLLEEE